MRKILIQSLVGTGLTFGALTLGAQQTSPQPYQPQNYQRYDRAADRDHYRNELLNRVRSDLNYAQTRAYGGDKWRIARAKDTLGQFQSRMNSGQMDRRELSMTIDSVQRVVDNNRLPQRVQQNLNNDLSRLRDMQYRIGA